MIKIKLLKSEVEFIERRLWGMTFYEERIKPKIIKAQMAKVKANKGIK